MLITHYEPGRLFDQFNHDINRLFSGSRSGNAVSGHSDWTPAVDIREEQERFVLVADLPGVERDAVEITVEDSMLTIKGERTTVSEETREGQRRRERVQGSFLRQFKLPDTADMTNISATARDGVLEVVIPKQEKLQPKKIAVN